MSSGGNTLISLAEIKAFLRLDTSDEDALLSGLLRSAECLCEAFTGQVLIESQHQEIVTANNCWQRLSATPVVSFDSAVIIAEGGETPGNMESEIDASGDGWVRVNGGGAGARARISFTAGLAADWNGVPEPLRQGIIRFAAHLYTHRDAASDQGPPAAVAALWRPWRRMRLS